MSHIDLQPTLVGSHIKLRPLVQDDFESLYQAASDPKIWEQHPDSQRYKREVFNERYFLGAIASGGALAIEETTGGRVIGSSRYYDWNPDTREVSIGYTFIECQYWGSGVNAELKRLMLSHIYQWADTAWFHVGKDNMRSRRAVEKLGATLSYEEERALDGVPFTQLYYRLEGSRYGAQ